MKWLVLGGVVTLGFFGWRVVWALRISAED